jgi:hypothetical protein
MTGLIRIDLRHDVRYEYQGDQRMETWKLWLIVFFSLLGTWILANLLV